MIQTCLLLAPLFQVPNEAAEWSVAWQQPLAPVAPLAAISPPIGDTFGDRLVHGVQFFEELTQTDLIRAHRTRLTDSTGQVVFTADEEQVDDRGVQSIVDLAFSEDGTKVHTLVLLLDPDLPTFFKSALSLRTRDSNTGALLYEHTLMTTTGSQDVEGTIISGGGFVLVSGMEFEEEFAGGVFVTDIAASRVELLDEASGALLTGVTLPDTRARAEAIDGALGRAFLTVVPPSLQGEFQALELPSLAPLWSVPAFLGEAGTAVPTQNSDAIVQWGASSGSGFVQGVEPQSGTLLWSESVVTSSATSIDCDGQGVAVLTRLASAAPTPSELRLLDASTGVEQWSTAFQLAPVGTALSVPHVRFSADGATIAVATDARELRLFDRSTGVEFASGLIDAPSLVAFESYLGPTSSFVAINSGKGEDAAPALVAVDDTGTTVWDQPSVSIEPAPARLRSRKGIGDELHSLFELAVEPELGSSDRGYEVRDALTGVSLHSWLFESGPFELGPDETSPDGAFVATLGREISFSANPDILNLRVHDASTGTVTLDEQLSIELTGFAASLTENNPSLVWNQAGDRLFLIAMSNTSCEVRAYDPSLGELWTETLAPTAAAFDHGLAATVIEPGGDLALVCGQFGGSWLLARLDGSTGQVITTQTYNADALLGDVFIETPLMLMQDAPAADLLLASRARGQVPCSSRSVVFIQRVDSASLDPGPLAVVRDVCGQIRFSLNGVARSAQGLHVALADEGPASSDPAVRLFALDPTDLTTLWEREFAVDEPLTWPPPQLATRSGGDALAFWHEAPTFVAPVGFVEQSVMEFDALTGKRLWVAEDLEQAPVQQPGFPSGGLPGLTVAGSRLILSEQAIGPFGTGATGFRAIDPAPLLDGARQISFTTGGRVPLLLEAGPAAADQPYLVLFSLSGTLPGVTLDGLTLFLAPDALTTLSLNSANQGPFVQTLGLLDASGTARAELDLPPVPSLLFQSFFQAFLTLDPLSGAVAFVSQPTTFVTAISSAD